MRTFSSLERYMHRVSILVRTETFRAIGSGKNPAFDWKLCATAFLVLAVVFGLVGGLSYLAVIGDDLAPSVEASGGVLKKIDQKKLNDAEAFFKVREMAGASKMPSFLDPSL